jgi:hypothetical protein
MMLHVSLAIDRLPHQERLENTTTRRIGDVE